MANIAKLYTKELRGQTGYSATWLPNVRVEVGDVCTLRGYRYTRVTCLADLKIDFSEIVGNSPANFVYSTKDAVEISAVGEGSTAVGPNGDARVRFTKSGAVVFAAAGCLSRAIDNQAVLADSIVRARSAKAWTDDWYVVTEVVAADRATILVASGSDSEVTVRGLSPLGGVELADGGLGLSLTSQHRMAAAFAASNGLTPLFRAARLRPRWFDDPVLVGSPDVETPSSKGGLNQMESGDYQDWDEGS